MNCSEIKKFDFTLIKVISEDINFHIVENLLYLKGIEFRLYLYINQRSGFIDYFR